MSAEPDGYSTRAGTLLAYGVWHSFGGPCEYRVTGTKRQTFYIRLVKTGEVAKPRGPAGRDALMMAMYYQCRAESYEVYAFGARAIDEGETFARSEAILQKYLGDPIHG